jgi:Fe-S cluster biogenesis protein NfuA/nitrite reductase/ring-hydroxylating ferredoxin subunit
VAGRLRDSDARQAVAEIERLLDEAERMDDQGHSLATEVVQALLQLYGEGLSRIVSVLDECEATEVRNRLTEDELVSHLMLLHDLHPVSLEARIVQALDDVRPYLKSHGGNVELLAVEGSVARLRLEGSCSGCPSSAVTLRLAVEEAVYKAAPEIERVEAEGVVEPKRVVRPLAVVPGNTAAVAARTGNVGPWLPVDGIEDLERDSTRVLSVGGERLLLVHLADGTRFAHHAECPGCGDALDEVTLADSEIVCSACGLRYDVRRAGRCVDDPDLQLEPLPLLTTEAGLVTVAIEAHAR